jgi:hypothetical protein
MEFEENNVKIEGNSTRNLKEKHKEFFTRVIFVAALPFLYKKL